MCSVISLSLPSSASRLRRPGRQAWRPRVLLCTAIALSIVTWPASVAGAEPSSPDAIVAAYGAAWNEDDVDKRRALLERAWADDGVYADPSASVVGREALVQHISGFLASFPGATLSITSGIDTHHDQHLRFTWQITNADGQMVAAGMDYGELASDGRLAKIIGFFGPFPEASGEEP